ncbi:MAG: dihydrofolate reductase [Clostridia bacterium]|nr:dihydrofolate reductase [Clostridia bacterium]
MLKKLVSVDQTGIEEFIKDDLEKIAEEIIFYQDYPTDESEILDRLKDADGLLVSWNTKIPKSILSQLPQLKYIGLCCSLITPEASNVDVKYAWDQNITVTDVKHYGDEGVVEYIISEMIQRIKGLKGPQLFSEQIELSDLKIGIIGMGILGEKVAKACEAFKMSIYYYNRSEKSVPYTYLPLDQLVETCDVITTHLPRHVKPLDEVLLKKFKGNKMFFNTSLTPTYDQESLLEWLKNESHYAYLDGVSLSQEERDTLCTYPNVFLTKQVTGFTKTARKRLANTVLNNLKNYLKKD